MEPDLSNDFTQPEGTATVDGSEFAGTQPASTPVVPAALATREPEVEVKPLPAPVNFGQDPAEQAKPVVPQGTDEVSSRRAQSILSSPIGSIVAEEAGRAGFDKNKLAAIISIESSGNPNATTGSYHGLGQLSHDEFATHGDGSGSIFDPRANIRATIKSLQVKEAGFTKEFGHAPSATELYLMHQQGEAGLRSHIAHPDWPAWRSMLATGEGARKGEGWAKKAIWGNVPSDMRAQFGSVDNITSADFVAIWDSKLHGNSFKAPTDQFAQQIKPADINPAPAISESQVMAGNRAAADYADQHSVLTEAWAQNSLTQRAWDSVFGQKFSPDPSFQLTPDLQKDLQTKYNLTPESMEALGNSVSAEHADFLAQRQQAQQQSMGFLADQGLVGTGASLFIGAVDPLTLAGAVVTGGASEYVGEALALGRGARVALSAATGAGINAGIDLAARGLGDPYAGRDLAASAAMGALFSSAFGWVGRNPATAGEAEQIRQQAQTLRRSLQDGEAHRDAGSVGAAASGVGLDPFINEHAAGNLRADQVPEGYKGPLGANLRISAAGQMRTSPSPISRLLAGVGFDAVGWKDKSVNEISAGEKANQWFDQHLTRLHQVWQPAAEEWAADQGYSVLKKIRAGSQFNEEVYRYVTTTDPAERAQVHQAVKRVGDRIAELNREILRMAQNPGEREGVIRRAVQGFESVKENEHYMTRVYAAEKLNALRADIGDEGIRQWFMGAIRKAQPDLENEEIEKLAKWHTKRITERANGIDTKMNLAWSGFDQEQLKEALSEAGFDKERINKLLQIDRDEKTGADARAKRRLMLAEDYVLKGYQGTSGMRDVRLGDMVVTDAALLSHLYWRHMMGRIALADHVVRNPETGEVIFNGFTSDGEIASARNMIAKWNGENGISKKQTDLDQANFDYMINRILSRSDTDVVGDAAKWLQRFGDVSYIRLGANFGMAQIPELIMPVATLSVRALMQMPSFKRVVTASGESILKDELGRTLEAMIGLGADAAKGFQYFRYEDLGQNQHIGTGMLDNSLGFMKQAVSHLSGLHFIDAAQRRWTGKAILQRFADMARKATADGEINLDKIKASHLDRMRYLGLDDGMLKRVLTQVRDNATTERGMLFDHKLTRLNMDGWADQEARAAFENAVYRSARNIIQTNDIGALHRWMAHPIARMMMQFRVFPLVAWEKQMLHNLHMADMQSFNMMWMSMAMGAATYALQTQLSAMGRSDREDYLKKRLTPEKLALGGFQRSGWSTLLPTLFDTGAYMVGGSPVFDFRVSGQATDALFGNPVVSTIDDIAKASKGVVQPILQHRQRSQQESRNIARLAPGATWLPAVNTLSLMIRNQPLLPPKQNQNK